MRQSRFKWLTITYLIVFIISLVGSIGLVTTPDDGGRGWIMLMVICVLIEAVIVIITSVRKG